MLSVLFSCWKWYQYLRLLKTETKSEVQIITKITRTFNLINIKSNKYTEFEKMETRLVQIVVPVTNETIPKSNQNKNKKRKQRQTRKSLKQMNCNEIRLRMKHKKYKKKNGKKKYNP